MSFLILDHRLYKIMDIVVVSSPDFEESSLYFGGRQLVVLESEIKIFGRES